MKRRSNCPLCESDSSYLADAYGTLEKEKVYKLYECKNCGYIFVQNPRTDYENLYNSDYYCGRGADPLVNYIYEAEHPDETLRILEWRGIVKVLNALGLNLRKAKCLDFGCGTGGFVYYARSHGYSFYAYDACAEYVCTKLETSFILSDNELALFRNDFDCVIMIEVLEHLENPVQVLSRIRRFMKKGALLFMTTGNSAPWRKNIMRWNYIIPELHLGYFSPQSLSILYKKSGFRPYTLPLESYDGLKDIILYKILKSFKFKKFSRLQNFFLYTPVCKLANMIYRISSMPIAIAN